MLIDCTTCLAPPTACGDCVVTALLSRPAAVPAAVSAAVPAPVTESPTVDLDESERAALGLLADAGLVPPLRLVRPVPAGRTGGELSDSA